MKSPIIVAAVSVLMLLGVANIASATSAVVDLPFTLDDSQISSILGHDLWQSGKVYFPADDLSLKSGDILQLNLTFNNCKALKLSAGGGFLGDDQSIDFFIGGSQNIDWKFWNVRELPYEWTFTDVTGDLDHAQPVTGEGVLLFNGDGFDAKILDLTDTNFTFCDIELAVTVPDIGSKSWTPDFAKFSVDSKDVDIVRCPPIPEPLTMSMLAVGVASVGGYIRRRLAR